jgi:hypothetical protein
MISRADKSLYASGKKSESTNCRGVSASALSIQYGGDLRAAAAALRFPSVPALQIHFYPAMACRKFSRPLASVVSRSAISARRLSISRHAASRYGLVFNTG